MRPLLLILGIVILIPGLVLLLVPLVPHPAKDVTTTTLFSYHATERVPLLSSLPVAVSWTSSTPVTVRLYVCPTFSPGATNISILCPNANFQTESGTSGGTTVSIPNNGGVAVTLAPGSPAGSTVSVTLKATSPTVGLGLVGLGAVVVVVSFLFKRRPAVPARPKSGAPVGSEEKEPAPPSDSGGAMPEGDFVDQ